MQRFARSLFPTILCGLMWVVALGRCSSSDEHPAIIQPPNGTGGMTPGSGGRDAGAHADAFADADASANVPEVGAGGGGTQDSGWEHDASAAGGGGNSFADAQTDAAPICADGGLQTRETSCNDHVDNDCDGRIDCDDEDCQPGGGSTALTCDALGHTCAAAVDAGSASCSLCPGGQEHETNCGNSVDDDCDGKVDCADTDCLTLQCGVAATQICQGTQCIDMESGYSIKVEADRKIIPADGIAIDPITITLTSPQGFVIANKSIALSITGPGSWYGTGSADASTTLTVMTSSTGIAHATLLSSAAGGTTKITAILEHAQTGATISVDMPVVDSISLENMSTLMGVAGSGYQEENFIKFKVYAPNSQPYPAGLLVTVTHESLGGSALGPPRAAPVSVNGGIPVSTTTQKTDANGEITVTLYSGTVAGTRSVLASATAGGQTRTRLVPNIVIVGAKANGEHLSLICSPENIPALANTDCITLKMAVHTTCTLTAADRYDHRLGVARSVVFAAESGNMDISTGTPEYPSENQGMATAQLNAQGGKLPLDVNLDRSVEGDEYVPVPDAGADGGPASCGSIRNPRDGVVTVIAAMQGEEGFDDVNRNGVFDPGEPFIDLPEPYVDMNDNGTHDDNEYFIDTDQDGEWDAENNQWDANTTIWAETKIVFTSAASAAMTSDGELASRYLQLPSSSTLQKGNSYPVTVGFTDMNLNVIAPNVKLYETSYVPNTSDSSIVTFLLNPAYLSPAPTREKGFDFNRMYCPDGGDICYSRCADGIRTPTRCTIRSYLSNFEKRVEMHAIAKAIAPGDYEISASATVVKTTLTLTFPQTPGKVVTASP